MPSASSPGLVIALAVAGSPDEAMATATGVIDAAEATRNPYAISYALMAYGTAFPRRRSRACAGGDAPGRGDRSRQRQPLQRNPPGGYLGRTRRKFGEPLAALEYFALAIRRYHDAGNTASGRPTLAALAILLQRLARDEPAATIAGFASTPMTAVAVPEFGTAIAHLRAVLGDQTYDSLARKGETMTIAEMATYAYDQIDQARAELNAVSK